jgi:hypothetical protein
VRVDAVDELLGLAVGVFHIGLEQQAELVAAQAGQEAIPARC